MAAIPAIQEGTHPQAGAHPTSTGARDTTTRPAAPARDTPGEPVATVLDPQVAEEFARKVQETLA